MNLKYKNKLIKSLEVRFLINKLNDQLKSKREKEKRRSKNCTTTSD